MKRNILPIRMPRGHKKPIPLQPISASSHATLTLLDVPAGYQAKIGSQPGGAGLKESNPSVPTHGLAQLQAYGLQAGYWVRVLQRSPVVVLQIDQLELAMEPELAAQVIVEEISQSM